MASFHRKSKPIAVPPLSVPKPETPPSSGASSSASTGVSTCRSRLSMLSSNSNRVRAERTRPRDAVVAGRVHPQVLSPPQASPIRPFTRAPQHKHTDSGVSYSVEISGRAEKGPKEEAARSPTRRRRSTISLLGEQNPEAPRGRRMSQQGTVRRKLPGPFDSVVIFVRALRGRSRRRCIRVTSPKDPITDRRPSMRVISRTSIDTWAPRVYDPKTGSGIAANTLSRTRSIPRRVCNPILPPPPTTPVTPQQESPIDIPSITTSDSPSAPRRTSVHFAEIALDLVPCLHRPSSSTSKLERLTGVKFSHELYDPIPHTTTARGIKGLSYPSLLTAEISTPVPVVPPSSSNPPSESSRSPSPPQPHPPPRNNTHPPFSSDKRASVQSDHIINQYLPCATAAPAATFGAFPFPSWPSQPPPSPARTGSPAPPFPPGGARRSWMGRSVLFLEDDIASEVSRAGTMKKERPLSDDSFPSTSDEDEVGLVTVLAPAPPRTRAETLDRLDGKKTVGIEVVEVGDSDENGKGKEKRASVESRLSGEKRWNGEKGRKWSGENRWSREAVRLRASVVGLQGEVRDRGLGFGFF